MAKHVESNISDQLRSLIRLQHIDSKLDRLKKLRGDLPDEISDLEDEIAGLKTRIENVQKEQADSEVMRTQSDRDIKESEGLIKKYEEQQLQVRNNREYDALTKEIEAQRQRIIDSQMRIETIDATKDERLSAVEEAKAGLAEREELLAAKQKELDEVLEDTKHEQADLEGIREKAAESVDQRYLRAYERLRTRLRDGRAVVGLERGAAGGFAVPPQRQVEIRQRNRIVACEHTGRIIVDQELFAEASAEVAELD
jgi:predicted  nucleic acid-binding Zn-ribbon protein